MPNESLTARALAELGAHPPTRRCCRGALIEGMLLASGGDELAMTRLASARTALAVLHADGWEAHVERVAMPRRSRYVVHIAAGAHDPAFESSERSCCARSRLAGAFMAAGRVSRPDAAPHLEIECHNDRASRRLATDARRLDIVVQTARRGHGSLVLARSAESVAALLTSIGAPTARLEFEDGRVIRELRGAVNRRLNAETANLHRSAEAAVRQCAVARALMDDPGRWGALPPALREAAELRLRHPREPLERLAREAGCSRSAMAGRLTRLAAFGG